MNNNLEELNDYQTSVNTTSPITVTTGIAPSGNLALDEKATIIFHSTGVSPNGYYKILKTSYFDNLSVSQLLNNQRKSKKLIILSKIRDLNKFKDGWSGDASKAASMQARNDAEIFVDDNKLYDFMIPDISLSVDGEICFWWDLPSSQIHLSFSGDGTYSYYVAKGSQSFGAECVPCGELLLDNFIREIN